MIEYNGTNYKMINDKWYFFIVNGDDGIIPNNSWFQLINKENIKEISTYYLRIKKLERILCTQIIK